jgi:drug/metabolite transporter (DMT)-like permease
MIKGIIYALAACFIWGLTFVVPGFMQGYSWIEIALGPYFVYGALSSIIFFNSRFRGMCKYPMSIWLRASYSSFIYTVGYFFCIVLAVKLSNPAICALIVGLSPIAIAFYGNWREKIVSYKSLVFPSLLTIGGLTLINIPHLQTSPVTHLWGVVFALLAVAGWSWYVVANANFLKHNLEVKASEWATLMGVTCLFWVGLFGLFFGLFFPDQFNVQKCVTLGPGWIRFAAGSLILGVAAEWLASYLWNKASVLIPVSLAGQLTIFETVFGVIFFYLLEQKFPPVIESVGIVLFLCSIIYGVRKFIRNDKPIDYFYVGQ